MEFTSHIGGKNAAVAIYPDRIEWSREGKARLGLAAVTLGVSALAPGARRKGGATEMILVRAITSVTTKKEGLRNYAVSVIAPGNSIDMRVSKDEAEQIKATLLDLMRRA